MAINDLRLLPAGTKIWSIALQRQVMFTEDTVVKITKTVIGDNDTVFGHMQILFGMCVGLIPSANNSVNGEVKFSLQDSDEYKLPAFTLGW